jgi:hypothetical protein
LGTRTEFHNTRWFERMYPGWVSAARSSIKAEIETQIQAKCPSMDTNITTVIKEVTPYYNAQGPVWWYPRVHDPDQGAPPTETDYGDKPQSRMSADQVLGNFVFKSNNISVDYTKTDSQSGCVITYTYSGAVIVEDVLGVQVGDALWFLRKIVPSRAATRASWPISGDGSCCCE